MFDTLFGAVFCMILLQLVKRVRNIKVLKIYMIVIGFALAVLPYIYWHVYDLIHEKGYILEFVCLSVAELIATILAIWFYKLKGIESR